MLTKHITVANRVATYTKRDGNIICNNSGYKIVFSFDSEWVGKATKYARFIWNGMYKDVQITGNECSVPIIQGAERVQIGVCSGDPENLTPDDFWTTTPAVIPCKGSVLCLTDQAQPGRVQQMRDATIQAAENAAESAEEAAASAATAASVVSRAEQAADRIENAAVTLVTEELLDDGTVNVVLESNIAEDIPEDIPDETTDVTAGLTWTENTFIDQMDGSFRTADGFRYSNIITLNRGEAIRVTASGASNSVALISKWNSNGNTFISCVHQAAGNTVEIAEHIATETEYLRICYHSYWTTKDGGALKVETYYVGISEPDEEPEVPAGTQISQINGMNLVDKRARERVNELAEELRSTVEDMEDNEAIEVVEEILDDGTVNIVIGSSDIEDAPEDTPEDTTTDITNTLTWTENTYINFSDGVFKTAEGFRYSNLITLNRGEAIRVTASGGSASVALISKWNSDGSTFISCVHQATGNTVETAEHTATETEYLRVCYHPYSTTKDGGALKVETYQGQIETPAEPGETLAECSQINGRNLVDRGAREFTNPLFGKSICVDGDSITYGQGNYQNGVYKGWADIIAAQNGMTVRKLAKSGATLTTSSNSICDRVSNITAADYIIISGGYNDYANGVELGELTEQGFRVGIDTIDTFESKTLDKTKVIDAVEYIVRYLLATYPTKKLGFVFTHKVGGEWYRPKTSQKQHTLKEYHDAIVSVLEKYSFPYCDLTQISRFNTGTPTYAAKFTNNGDAIHPNQSGYEIGYVPQITAWLKTL